MDDKMDATEKVEIAINKPKQHVNDYGDYDAVQKPSHYYEGRTIAPWDLADDWELDLYLGTAVKYIGRAGRKIHGNEISDLEKAIKCINRRIEILKGLDVEDD